MSTAAATARVDAPAWRLVATLALAGALAGLLLVFVSDATRPRIEAYKEKMLALAVGEVLGDPHDVEALFLVDGRLVRELPADVEERSIDRVFCGIGDDGGQIGFAIVAAEPGFQDVVKLIFGYDPSDREILGMKVLESKETPGLGDKIEKDRDFIDQFQGALTPLVGVKSGKGIGGTDEIDMITGATISSRAVVRIINQAVERWSPLVRDYGAEARE